MYKDEKGNLHEKVVSLFEAVERSNQRLSVIDEEYNKDKGWEFQFTMKQNEMFVFPNNDFDIEEVNLKDVDKASLISIHLFRVQSISTKNYNFRHHLETVVTNDNDFTYKRRRTPKSIENIKKVRINHIGQIVQVGEYWNHTKNITMYRSN